MTQDCPNGHPVTVHFSDSIVKESLWDQCPQCGAYDAYLQKAVPKNLFLGLLIVALAVTLYLLSENWILGMSVLFALTLIDFALFKFLPDLLVCYGCGSMTKGFANKNLALFDHHIGEKYRHFETLAPQSHISE